jgi:hypothetical protein
VANDWVLVGGPHPDGGVVVWASRHIKGEMHIRGGVVGHLDSYTHEPLGAEAIERHWSMILGAPEEHVHAATYPEALAELFRRWGATVNDPFSALGGPQPAAVEGRVIDG